MISLVLFFKTHPQQLLYILLIIQSAYIIYILETMPHVDLGFNVLEVVNEIVTTLLVYTLLGFMTNSPLDTTIQWSLGYISILFIAIVFTLNFISMILVMIVTIKKRIKKRKAKK